MSQPPEVPANRSVYVIGGACFVVHPNARGFWMKTDTSVAKIECPDCASEIGVPCMFRGKYAAGTHYARRRAARQLGRVSPNTITIHYRPA